MGLKTPRGNMDWDIWKNKIEGKVQVFSFFTFSFKLKKTNK